MLRIIVVILALLAAAPSVARGVGGTFASIDGGTHSLEAWRGRPVLVVNTASQCAFTGQYAALQKVYDAYKARGLVVLAVPSDDFNQELDSAAEVKAFCELNYDLDLPMTDITPVTGPDAHPFYKSVRSATGFAPRWNFNKVLIGPDGDVVATYGSATRPDSRKIVDRIEGLLP
ncbi:glutathione peroxidase [Cribrihabitans marinus]|uniref:Glutathione peroxidase n=1 Tax=Cribrihabitans marinus TaxID=1227549 RepID=A0A1H7DJM9_9RHOB|nr:glutathione peroxidase [Cribrihabitans marinus]GGH39359.1 glutathione peroxidase [Cribrihabitans marinus]SEK01117.1 glutathione peroxidase [Cribrihabitans marinus]